MILRDIKEFRLFYLIYKEGGDILDRLTMKEVLRLQKGEITEYEIYKDLAKLHSGREKKLLMELAEDEKRHYNFFRGYSKKDIKPDWFMVKKVSFLTRIFGLTFGLKSMEQWEENTQKEYKKLQSEIPEIEEVIIDEQRHEQEIKNMDHEGKLIYISSIVLGLNDALIELTGALAGYTFALGSTREIALVGLITGIAASMSMASSEYLSSKANLHSKKNHITSALITGVAYIATVFLLVFPYLLPLEKYLALGISFFIAVIIIFVFNYYSSVVNRDSFKKRFLEMFSLSLGIAFISFLIGGFLKKVMNIDM